MQGRILKGVGGLYEVYLEGKGSYACRAKGIFRKKKIRPNVGDYVDIDILSETDREGNITVIHPRKNSLIRPMVANVDQAMILFAVHEPEPNYHLLNTFLIMMQQQNVPVAICINKMDLADPEDAVYIRKNYEKSGAGVHFISAIEGDGMEEIREILDRKTTVLAGPSGVGKSSLLNSLVKETRMETGSVSIKIKRGRHTTRHSELIHIARDTYVLDTPGFSSLYLPEMEKEKLKDYFSEFTPCEGHCRFLDCSHITEPDCAVKKAVEDGEISRLRYDDYVYTYEELAQKKKW